MGPRSREAPADPATTAVQTEPANLNRAYPQVDVSEENALGLLQRAQGELAARKCSMDAEIARIETLTREHDLICAQLGAVDEAIKAFANSKSLAYAEGASA